MAADRGIYVDQSQSFNVHMAQPSFGIIYYDYIYENNNKSFSFSSSSSAALTSMHFYGWKKGKLLLLLISLLKLLLLNRIENWNVLFANKSSNRCNSVYSEKYVCLCHKS
jgi:hypothetical protein